MEPLPTEDELRRRTLFTPCETKEQLANWIRVFLDIDLPDCTVSEESNSNPMDLLWELYSKARANDDESFAQVMAYAGRGGYKTLSASVLEILSIFHMRRNVGHMAATKEQSKRSQEYVRDFMAKPYIADYKVVDKEMRVEIAYFHDKETGRYLTTAQYNEVPDELKRNFEKRSNFIQIVICSLRGANGLHAEFCVADELDTIEGEQVRGYKEFKNIPKARNGLMPITLLTSTRKFSYGLVQQELDNAEKTGLHTRHWNSIDTAERCLPARHRPEEPMVDLYVNDDAMDVVQEERYNELDPKTKEKYVKHRAFAGCVTCPLFSGCKTRLATHQTSTSPMLSPLGELIPKFKSQTLDDVQTQLLCRKASSAGLIYSKFNPEIHMKTGREIWRMAFDEDPGREVTKTELMDEFLAKGARFYAGMDFGFTHNFAVTMSVVWGQFCFITTVIAAPGLELDEKIAICEPLKKYDPTIFGDTEAPADIKTFKRKGFKMREWDKYKGSVKAGIEVVRMKLKPASGPASLFLLKGDPGCEALAADFLKYHFLTDANGNISDEPDENGDDILDSMRYMVMNVFAPKGKVLLPPSAPMPTISGTEVVNPGRQAEWMQEKIRSLTGDPENTSGTGSVSIRKGKFSFDV